MDTKTRDFNAKNVCCFAPLLLLFVILALFATTLVQRPIFQPIHLVDHFCLLQVPHDTLKLRVPVYVTGITWLDSEETNTLAVVTGYGHVRFTPCCIFCHLLTLVRVCVCCVCPCSCVCMIRVHSDGRRHRTRLARLVMTSIAVDPVHVGYVKCCVVSCLVVCFISFVCCLCACSCVYLCSRLFFADGLGEVSIWDLRGARVFAKLKVCICFLFVLNRTIF